MRPKLPTNAIAYTILSLAGAGSFFVPGEALMPTTAAQTIPAETSTDGLGEHVTATVPETTPTEGPHIGFSPIV